jgi:hypothetical protein
MMFHSSSMLHFRTRCEKGYGYGLLNSDKKGHLQRSVLFSVCAQNFHERLQRPCAMDRLAKFQIA